jgi:hypothetical protein
VPDYTWTDTYQRLNGLFASKTLNDQTSARNRQAGLPGPGRSSRPACACLPVYGLVVYHLPNWVSSSTPRARRVLSKPSDTISLAARDSVPKTVLRSSSSSRSKSITSIAIGRFEEERNHNHGQESRWEGKEHLCPNLYPIRNYLYYYRYSGGLVGRQAGRGPWPACCEHWIRHRALRIVRIICSVAEPIADLPHRHMLSLPGKTVE